MIFKIVNQSGIPEMNSTLSWGILFYIYCCIQFSSIQVVGFEICFCR